MAILNLVSTPLIRFPLLDTPGDGTSGGATGGTATATADAASNTGTTGTTAATSTQDATRTSAASTGFSYPEDRSRWIPPHRLNEETTKRTALETQLAEAQNRIKALAGVQPTDPQTEKSQQIREAFLKMFPQFKRLADLSDEQLDALIETPQHLARVNDSETRESMRHGKTQMVKLQSMVADALGADELSSDQQDDLREGFAAWFRGKCDAELRASGGNSSATLERYENGDEALLQEYVKRHTSNWVEPARRKVTAQTLSRTRPVPNSQGRAQVTSTKRPEKFANLDERLNYAVEVAKERGVQFGR